MAGNRSWLWRRFDDDGCLLDSFVNGVESFIQFAYSRVDNLDSSRRIKCPCSDCKNLQFYDEDSVRQHLIWKGFAAGYSFWSVHGESVQVVQENLPCAPSSSCHNVGHQQMVVDAYGAHGWGDCYASGDAAANTDSTSTADVNFLSSLRDASEPLWDGCTTHTVLSSMSELMMHKAKGHISERVFDGLLQTVKGMLPPDDKLPKNFYEMKKKISKLGLGYVKIHACINNCMLYHNQYADVTKCHVCDHNRYKQEPFGCRKGIPFKVLHYLPIIPRLKHLYASEKTTQHMTWHAFNRCQSGVMQHPTDSKAWNHFNSLHPTFADDPRNVRLGISTDGFAPFEHYGSKYSCWPVIITVYNLPPWMCMKEPYLLLNMVIPGPGHPGNSIDVFLRPLIDELLVLWSSGVPTFDASSKETFLLKAAVMWTISDLPAYAMLSGWRTQGKLACPHCMESSTAFGLSNGRKVSFFDCHRAFLPPDHNFRKQRDTFRKGTVISSGPPPVLSGEELYHRVCALPEVTFGKRHKDKRLPGFGVQHNWLKKSIFWELPYWSTNLIRHTLDVMHIEKNVFENIWNTVMDVKDRTKDNAKARADLKIICKRPHLELYKANDTWIKPNASYVLTKDQQRAVYQWLKELRLPYGYGANISRCVNVEQLHVSGLKTHDCHVMIQRLLPVAFRDFLPTMVWDAITEVGQFLRDICAQTLHVGHLEQLEANIVVTLCKLEKNFPPGFFDPSVHLLVHLAHETKLRGPVQYSWMYRFERFLGKLKRKVGNKARVEASICEAYLIEETSTFCAHYFSPDIRTRLNRVPRNDDGGELPVDSRLSIFRHPGRGYALINVDAQQVYDALQPAHTYVLLNTSEICPYVRMFDDQMRIERPTITEVQLEKLRSTKFASWMNLYVLHNDVDEQILGIGCGPSGSVRRYKGYFTNGFNFQTERLGNQRSTMNSGICVAGGNFDYYGKLVDIWELEYLGPDMKVVLFRCIWFDTCNKMRVHPNHGLVEIYSKSRLKSAEEFVLASQAQQVYYMEYPCRKQGLRGWWAAVKTTPKSRYTSIIGAPDEISMESNETYQEGETVLPPNPELGLHFDNTLFHDEGGVELHPDEVPPSLQAMDNDDRNTTSDESSDEETYPFPSDDEPNTYSDDANI